MWTFTKFVLHNSMSPFGSNYGASAKFPTTQWNRPPLIGSFLPEKPDIFFLFTLLDLRIKEVESIFLSEETFRTSMIVNCVDINSNWYEHIFDGGHYLIGHNGISSLIGFKIVSERKILSLSLLCNFAHISRHHNMGLGPIRSKLGHKQRGEHAT